MIILILIYLTYKWAFLLLIPTCIHTQCLATVSSIIVLFYSTILDIIRCGALIASIWRWLESSFCRWVGKQKIKLQLRVIYRISTDYFINMAPLAHNIIVLVDEGEDWSIEIGLECLDYMLFAHGYLLCGNYSYNWMSI